MKAIITSTLFFLISWFKDFMCLWGWKFSYFRVGGKLESEWKCRKKFLLIYFRLWKWLSHFLYHRRWLQYPINIYIYTILLYSRELRMERKINLSKKYFNCHSIYNFLHESTKKCHFTPLLCHILSIMKFFLSVLIQFSSFFKGSSIIWWMHKNAFIVIKKWWWIQITYTGKALTNHESMTGKHLDHTKFLQFVFKRLHSSDS